MGGLHQRETLHGILRDTSVESLSFPRYFYDPASQYLQYLFIFSEIYDLTTVVMGVILNVTLRVKLVMLCYVMISTKDDRAVCPSSGGSVE